MKAQIKDIEVFLALRPLSLVGYLRARGWQKYSEKKGRNSVWIHPNFEEAEIVIPLRREASDYLVHMKNILNELEEVEQRSQLDIARDLLNSGFDVIRIAAKAASTGDGTIKIDDGVRLFSEARNILLSAACSAINPRSVFHSRKPQQANDYMNATRLGQTEHGSYVLTILSPVAPQLNAYSETELFPEEPFERKVVKTLAAGVQLAISAAEIANLDAENAFEPFQHAVTGGVSANLCESLVGLHNIQNSTEIEMSFGWALNRPFPQNVMSKILISADVIPTIAEAAKIFRQKDTLESYPIIGPVVKLEREDGSPIGHVTVLARVEDTVRKVVMQLSTAEYETATQAHKNYRAICVRGDIKKDGRTYQLFNPTGFSLSVDDEGIAG